MKLDATRPGRASRTLVGGCRGQFSELWRAMPDGLSRALITATGGLPEQAARDCSAAQAARSASISPNLVMESLIQGSRSGSAAASACSRCSSVSP